VEYFIDDNVAFGIEGKYLWIDSINGSVDNRSVPVDLSSPLFTFGLRVFFDENHPQPLITADKPAPWRLYAGLRLGGGVFTDNELIPGVTLTRESCGVGSVNQAGELLLGMDFRDGWGIELASECVEPNITAQNLGTIGEYSTYTVIPYLRLRHPLDGGRWQPYFVAGMGISYAEFNDAKPPAKGLIIDANGFEPAAGVGGGIEYFITRNFSWNLDVRWLHTWGHEVRIGNTMQGTGDLSTLVFGVGYRVYLFEGRSHGG
jgi:hypothetical protein